MPVYQYQALDDKGVSQKGIIDASTAREAREKLRGRKLFVTDMNAVKSGAKSKKQQRALSRKSASGRIEEEPETTALSGGFEGVGFELQKVLLGRARRELVSVTRLMATLLKAGITLVDALGSVIQQVEDKYLSTVLRQVREDVKGGVSIADSLAQHPVLFDSLYVNMVRAGEASGALDDVLGRLAGFLQAQNRMKNRVVAAMIYPLAMMIMGGIVVIFLLAFVVPRIVAVVTKRGGPLPLPTKILIFMKDMVVDYWWLGLALFMITTLAYFAFTSSEKGALWRDTYKLRIPVLGNLFRKQSVARFAHTFATLLRSGIQATECLKILAAIVDNKLLGNVLIEVRTRILEGTDISTPLKNSKIFPPVVGDMIAIGEQSGQLEDLLERIAETYDEEVDLTAQKVTALIEPVIIIAMAGVVGFIVISIVLPLVQGFKF